MLEKEATEDLVPSGIWEHWKVLAESAPLFWQFLPRNDMQSVQFLAELPKPRIFWWCVFNRQLIETKERLFRQPVITKAAK